MGKAFPMKKNILFIHGGGDDGFGEDKPMMLSLQKALGADFNINYPKMPSDESLPDFGWLRCIENEISKIDGEIILIGHSLGASMLLKLLSENKITKKINGIFLIATPFWSGDEDWVQGLKLNKGFEEKIPKDIPLFLYHGRDDEEVSFKHLGKYSEKLPQAIVREIQIGGHQLNNNLTLVANDIKSL